MSNFLFSISSGRSMYCWTTKAGSSLEDDGGGFGLGSSRAIFAAAKQWVEMVMLLLLLVVVVVVVIRWKVGPCLSYWYETSIKASSIEQVRYERRDGGGGGASRHGGCVLCVLRRASVDASVWVFGYNWDAVFSTNICVYDYKRMSMWPCKKCSQDAQDEKRYKVQAKRLTGSMGTRDHRASAAQVGLATNESDDEKMTKWIWNVKTHWWNEKKQRWNADQKWLSNDFCL